MVPLVYGRCDIPGNLSIYHKLPYDPTNHRHKWFWEKLVKTLHPQGAFDSSINMLDFATPGQAKSSVTPSAPQQIRETKPTAIPEQQPKKLIPPSSQVQKPNIVPKPQKNPKSTSTLLSKISSPFSKSNKSKKNSGSDPFLLNLYYEPAGPGADFVQMEMEEETEEEVKEVEVEEVEEGWGGERG